MYTDRIDNLEDLWNLSIWAKNETAGAKPLKNYRTDKLECGEREIMICHDMKGGYLSEESEEGCCVDAKNNPFVFLNWWNVDIFCYFSHHFVSLPPISYTNIAHEHGCLVLGTFITEWHQGKALCDKFLKNEETVKKTVTCLVQLAEYSRIDGWLINIENPIDTEKLDLLRTFLRTLTDEMHQLRGHSRVIWYDSVTNEGQLKWQNALNHKNRDFYSVTDGIYLNYNWSDEDLLNSADWGLLHRIYVGIDVFARGCTGGWDTRRSLSLAHLLKMSVAVFAPGWITEKYPQLDPIDEGLRFWRTGLKHLPSRPISSLPVNTDFNAGFTKNGSHFCLNKMNMQPHYAVCNASPSMTSSGLRLRTAGIHRIFELDNCVDVKRLVAKSSHPIVFHLRGERLATKKVSNDGYLALLMDGRKDKPLTKTDEQSNNNSVIQFAIETSDENTLIWFIGIS